MAASVHRQDLTDRLLNLEQKALAANTVQELRDIQKMMDDINKLLDYSDRQLDDLCDNSQTFNDNLDKFVNELDAVIANTTTTVSLTQDYRDAWRDISNELSRVEGSYSRIANYQMGIGAATHKTVGDFFSMERIVRVLMGIVEDGVDVWLEMDDAAFKMGRNIGMSRDEINGFREGLIETYMDMTVAYGMTKQELLGLQETYISSTGKARLLNREMTEALAASSKLIGIDNVNQITDAMDSLGGGAMNAAAASMNIYARAKNQGLDAQKAAKGMAEALKMSQKYTFKEGVNGMGKMVAQAQALKTSLQSTETMLDKFSNVEDAITTSAKLQVLGGDIGAAFANPMEMMGLAMTDAEQFQEKALSGFENLAHFDEKTGRMDMAQIDKMRLKAAAEALGISYEDAWNAATQKGKQAEIQNAISANGLDSSLSKEEQDLIKNTAEYNTETNQWEIQYVDKNTGEVTSKGLNELTNDDLEQLKSRQTEEDALQDDVHTIRTLIENGEVNAKETLSTKEKLTGIKESTRLTVARGVEFIASKFGDLLNKVDGWGTAIVAASALAFGGAMWKGVMPALIGNFGRSIGGLLKGLGKGLWRGTKTVAKYGWRGAKAVGRYGWNGAKAVGRGIGRVAGNIANNGFGATMANGVRSAWNGAKNLGSVIANGTKNLGKAIANGARGFGTAIANGIKAVGRGIGSVAKNLGKAIANGARGFGTAIANGIKAVGRGIGRVAGKLGGGVRSAWNGARGLFSGGASAARGLGGGVLKGAVKGGGVGLLAYLAAEGANWLGKKSGAWEEGSTADHALNITSKTASYAGTGALIGSFVPVIGNAVGAAVGGAIGLVSGVIDEYGDKIGDGISSLLGNKEEVEAERQEKIQQAEQHNFEREKLGVTDIADPQLEEKSYLATIGIHDLLISWMNKEDGLGEEGESDEEKQERIDEASEKHWYDGISNFFGFSKGGEVPEPKYELPVNDGDTVLARLAPGEVVLNEDQQDTLRNVYSNIGLKDTVDFEGAEIKNNENNSGQETFFGKAKDTLSSVAMGAAVGSIVPGIGTALGGTIGGLIGMFKSNEGESKEVEPIVGNKNVEGDYGKLNEFKQYTYYSEDEGKAQMSQIDKIRLNSVAESMGMSYDEAWKYVTQNGDEQGNKSSFFDKAKDTLSSAAMGAAVGSIVPGIGTALGGTIGGLIGMFKSNEGGSVEEEKQMSQIDKYRMKAASDTMGNETTPSNKFIYKALEPFANEMVFNDDTKQFEMSQINKLRLKSAAESIGITYDDAWKYVTQNDGATEKNEPSFFDKAKGTLSSAAMGAAVGSIVPGIGTALGGAIGGLIGMFKSNEGESVEEEPSFFESMLGDFKNALFIDDDTNEIQMSMIDKMRLKSAAESMGMSYDDAWKYVTQNDDTTEKNEYPSRIGEDNRDLFDIVNDLLSPIDSSKMGVTTSDIVGTIGTSRDLDFGNLIDSGVLAQEPITPQVTPITTVGNPVEIREPRDWNQIQQPMSSTPQDINLNINGTLHIEGKNGSGDIDIKQLCNNTEFRNLMYEYITGAMNSRGQLGSSQKLGASSAQRGYGYDASNFFI